MGDVKLSPRQTAAILNKLDEGLRSVTDARLAVIQAMADRRAERPGATPRPRKAPSRKSK
jgi:hypothetical protein